MSTFTLNQIIDMDTQTFRTHEKAVYLGRWIKSDHPEEMFEWFQEGISKLRGDMWERRYRSHCEHLLSKLNDEHDAVLHNAIVTKNNLVGDKIEIKFFSAMSPDSARQIEDRGYALSWAERSRKLPLTKTGCNRPKGGSFQQVKPLSAQYGLFSAVFNNGAIHYWVPYHLVSKTSKVKNAEIGKIPLSGQHRGHKIEGQINMSSRFHELFLLDVTVGTPFITDLSKYDLSKYENLVF